MKQNKTKRNKQKIGMYKIIVIHKYLIYTSRIRLVCIKK